MKKILLLSFLSVLIFSCKKSGKTQLNEKTVIERYSVTEFFEVNDPKTKTSYVLDTINLATGSWIMNQALIGNLAADAKNGNFSVRFQKTRSFIETNFGVQNLDTLIFSYGKYNNKTDGIPNLTVKISNDNGVTYTTLGQPIQVSDYLLKMDTLVVKSTGNEKVRIKLESDGAGRLNIDDIIFKGKSPSGIIFNDGVENNTSDNSDISNNNGSNEQNPPRLVTAGDDVQPSSGDDSNMLLGNPSNATANITNKNNYLIDQRYYIESYDADRSTPNWVSWHLQPEDANGAVQRQDDFAAWAGLPSEWYAATQYSYSGSGYDRGHNCPSADRTSSVNANSATFLMTNMIPQASQNNQKTWNNLEMFIRDKVRKENYEAYIIMGSYGELKKIDNNRISVPSNVWKVVVFLPKGENDLSRITENTEILAINTPNDNTVKEDWKAYIVSISEIESATKYTLLSTLPMSLKSALKNKKYTPL